MTEFISMDMAHANVNLDITHKKNRVSDKVMYGLIYASVIFSIVLLISIIGYVLYKGIGVVNITFLTTVSSALRKTKGIAGNILNTVIIVLLTMLIATPIGVGSAIYLNEYAKNRKLVQVIEFATETLSGIPSIIFGLFGSMFFGETLHMGYSLLCGCLTLTLMVLPLITRNTQEALKSVNNSYRQGAIGLGAGKWYMIRTILIPSAMPGIITGVILAIGRVIAESAALIFTAGSAKTLPKTLKNWLNKIFTSGGTLTVALYLAATSEADFNTAFGIALVLLVIVLIINLSTKKLASHFDVRRVK